MGALQDNIIKLVGVDLDGTLLYSNKSNKYVSRESIDALNKFIKKNDGRIAVLTGRAMVSTREIVNYVNQFLIEPIRYVACFNGALIYDLKNQETIFEKKMPSFVATEIFKICKNNKSIFWMYPIILPKKNSYVVVNKLSIAKLLNFFKGDSVFYSKSLEDIDDTEAYKIIVAAKTRKQTEKIYKIICTSFPDLELAYTSDFSFEITSKGVNKGNAVNVILKQMQNISLDEVAVIGDSGNDKSMFQVAKISLAMPSSPDYLKNIATFVGEKSKRKTKFADLFSKIIKPD